MYRGQLNFIPAKQKILISHLHVALYPLQTTSHSQEVEQIDLGLFGVQM